MQVITPPPSQLNTQELVVSFILLDDMLGTSATLPSEMLLSANALLKSKTSSRNKNAPSIKLQTLTLDGEPITTNIGLTLKPNHALNGGCQAQIIYLPGLWRNPRPLLKRSEKLLAWLKTQHDNGALICAVGTGCCFLAEAGLLEGKAATTHWHYFDQFQKDYPSVDLKRQYFITQAGNIYCAASVNSLADLTVHFIQRYYGKEIANHVERHFSHEIRRAYESSGFFEETHNRHPDEQITQVQIWLQDNYAKPVKMEQLAEKFGMSSRNLHRRFRSALNITPLAYLQEIRINHAKDLLKTSNLSIAEIADKIGYQDSSFFSRLFKQHLATTPMAYRETVRGKLFSTK